MQRHDSCSRGKGGQGLDRQRVWGDPSSARRLPVGGCGSPPRWRPQPVKKERGCGGEEGRGVHAGRGGGGRGPVGARARGRGCGMLSRERHRSADRGGGAAGAGQSRPGSPGRPLCRGPRSAEGPATRPAGMNPAKHHPRGRIRVAAGESATPSPRGRTGPGRAPPDGYRRGGRALAPGLQGPGPWCLWDGAGGTGRASGLRLVRGGAEGPGWLGGEPREAPRSWARAAEGGRSLRRGGGGVLPARGTTGAPLEREGGAGVYRPV